MSAFLGVLGDGLVVGLPVDAGSPRPRVKIWVRRPHTMGPSDRTSGYHSFRRRQARGGDLRSFFSVLELVYNGIQE